MTSPIHLNVEGVSLSYPDRRLITDVSFAVSSRGRTGLIGENGCGKTTLLHIAAGDLTADQGLISRPSSVGFLRQVTDVPQGWSVGDLLESAIAGPRAIQVRVGQLAESMGSDPDDPKIAEDFSRALAEAEENEVWEIDSRLERVVEGLRVSYIPRERPLAEVSGGERRRLAMAAILLERPTLLILDEPTNHLDDFAADFLVEELEKWRGPVLFASHDRWFLDRIATAVIDMEPTLMPDGVTRQGTTSSGGYSAYLKHRAKHLRRWEELRKAQEEKRENLLSQLTHDARNIFHGNQPKTETRVARKFYSDRAAKTVSGRVGSVRRKLEILDERMPPPPPTPLTLAAPFGHNPFEGWIVSVDTCAVEGRLSETSLTVNAGEQLLITGANGSGKSTFLSLLDGTATPDTGSVSIRPGARVGILRQHDAWDDLSETADAAYRSLLERPEDAPSLHELGLLHAEQTAPLYTLSTGQRRRVALAPLLAEPPDLLLLDEPANHLSLRLVEELRAALATFEGAVITASHDRWLRTRTQGRSLALGGTH